MEIIAHRGSSHEAPENTLAAARLAWREGADALECDVHLTADRRLAVIHDPDTQRTGGLRRRVREATLPELGQIDVGRWKAPRFAGETVPSLEALLATVPPGKRVFIELKGGPELVPALDEALNRAAVPRTHVVVISFELETVRVAQRAGIAAEVCWIVERAGLTAGLTDAQTIALAREAGVAGLDLDYRWPVDATLTQRVHEAGLRLYVWTVDDPAVARALVDAGVDGITTNRPGWLRAELDPPARR